jgi:polar amino acid transport system substrate-binding protein
MKKSVFKVLIALTLVLAIAGFMVACAQGGKEESSAEETPTGLIEEVVRRGVLKVGIGIFVPWSFKDKDGNFAGFEVDVASKLAEDMGVDVEFVPTEWSGIIPALLTGKFDVIIGGMGITMERAMKVNFTNPYSYSGMDVVVSRKMLQGVTSMEQLNKENIVIAVRMGATPVAAAKRWAPNAQLHQFDDDAAVIQDVLNGNAHAAMSSSPKPAFWAADYPDTLYRPLGGEYLYSDPSAFAVRKGEYEAMFFFNAWIADNQDFLQERDRYWFGTRDWADMVAE